MSSAWMLGWPLVASLQAAGGELKRVSYEPPFEVGAHRVLEAEQGERGALIVVGVRGEVRSWRPWVTVAADAPPHDLLLPLPERTLVDTARFGATRFLVSASPGGVQAYPIDAGGSLAAAPQTWIARAKFTLRVGSPQLTGFMQDVNRDGLPDVVLPTPQACELWLASPGADGAPPQFRKAATVAVTVSRWGSREGEFLSDQLESSFAIPGLDTRDVNGDGRPDLLVEQEQRRAFHLQREDGSFPAAPDEQVDLSIFRDTTEAGSLQLGGVLTAGDGATWSSRDLDGDGIPDYVIGHRRKVWVFRGSKQGPQFKEPSAILKTAEDITVLSVIELDDDPQPDLLLVKIQVPTLSTLLRGLFGEWDVRIGALGYRNQGNATFETSPKWSNELVLRLPGIVGLLQNPEKIFERFTSLEKRFRSFARGDVNADGALDVLLASEDGAKLECWLGAANVRLDVRGERKVREILFDDKNTTWDLDRVVAAFGGLAQRQVALLTGERSADWAADLRSTAEYKLGALECSDLDGDARSEVLLGYSRVEAQRRIVFELLERR